MAMAYKDWGGLFKAADQDKDGVIDYEQLQSALNSYGYTGSEQEIKVTYMGV